MSCSTGKTVSNQVCINKKMFVYFYFTMAEYESGSVTESSDEEEEQLFVPRKKVLKVQETIYGEDCKEFVDDIVSGEDLGGDEFPVCFILRVVSRLAADELVTAIKDGSLTCCHYSTFCR